MTTKFPKAIRPTLDQVLSAAHRRVVLLAVASLGLTLGVSGLVALQFYLGQNLHLVARSISYTVEAAVVFGDRDATQEAVALIGTQEDVGEVEVSDTNGRVLAHWERADQDAQRRFEQILAGWLIPNPVVLPVVHDKEVIGQVHLIPQGQGLLAYLMSGLACVLVCLIVCFLVALRLSRRLQKEIAGPLRALAGVAHRARRDRTFELRAPPADIAELDELNDDFNALLDELEVWQLHLAVEHASLSHRASHDSLTSLPNRALLETELEKAVMEAARSNSLVAVMFLDSDRFKEINDTYGHASGDKVLVTVASRLKSSLREDDLVARLGGDEFAILLRKLHHADDAIAIADQIIASMRMAIRLPTGDDIYTSVSIGVAIFPEHATSPAALLDAADEAMYRAKQTQRGSRHVAGDKQTMNEE